MNEFRESDHTYWIGNSQVPSVTTILKSAGFYNESFFTEESRNRGTYCHKACLYHLQGDLAEDSIPEEYRGYIEAFKLFMAESNTKIEFAETPLYHEIEKWAGTPDIYGYLNGISCVIDIKTGQKEKVHGYQLSAYQALLFVNGYETINRFGLYLNKNGKYNLVQYKDRHDKNIFYAALCILRAREDD